MSHPIYLDNNATTLIEEEVLKSMNSLFKKPLNPSSIHRYGKEAKAYLTSSREVIAKYLSVDPEELYFTSGGTESLNLLIKGLYPYNGTILSTNIEHACIHETLINLKEKGYPISYVPVKKEGAPLIKAIEELLTPDITLMIFSAVYSETGSKIELKTLANLAKKRSIPLIIDGVALLGKEPFKIYEGISGMAFASHKLHGPKGIGLAFISSLIKCTPLVSGGHQEHDIRPGTENLEGIVGFAKAVSLLEEKMEESTSVMLKLRTYFETRLLSELKTISINGSESRVCNTSNILFHDIDGETLLLSLDRAGIYASLGSACSSGAIEPSRVLVNMGLSRKEAKSSLRFSLSRFTTFEEIEKTATSIIEIVKKLRTF